MEPKSTAGRVVVNALFDAFGRRDLAAVLELVTEDVELWPLGTAAELARREPYRGHDGMREYLADITALWTELTVTPGELRTAGAGVVAFGVAQGRTVDGTLHDGVPVIWIFQLEDGRVRSARISSAGGAG